jgi:glucuronate isomerase
MATGLTGQQSEEFLTNVRKLIERAVDDLPTHQEYLKAHCRAAI